ncbi:hypothetical protein [Bailinhaonella thermotolerans]|uniref:Uncharacterized protein n=1 Tax=Bailinhaonella thermotolerans TaxID=1070861 RepID=A0A3A4AVV5_9ACTN|nr:hypothetical protein [Bailinhaonella thermotolerans]RJL34350.1 hypothetical protein D5H75_07865 [Bailinhaonella thermotolerans]
MAWNDVHRRHRLVRRVLDGVAAAGRPEVPRDLAAEVEAEFGGLGGLLREVQARWYRAFDARLDAVLEERPADLAPALARLRGELAAAMPAARLLLDAHHDHPDLAALHARHRRTLAAAGAAGAAGAADPADAATLPPADAPAPQAPGNARNAESARNLHPVPPRRAVPAASPAASPPARAVRLCGRLPFPRRSCA